jgi:magnesium-transporting ATPase (P-type)
VCFVRKKLSIIVEKSKTRYLISKGAPEEVGNDFDCSYNALTSLEGAPKKVRGDFQCSENERNFTEADVKAVCYVKGKIYA